VDNFETIAIAQHSFLPLIARDYFAVQFDRYPVGLHPQMFDKRAQSFGGGRLAFSVNNQIHLRTNFILVDVAFFVLHSTPYVETRLATSPAACIGNAGRDDASLYGERFF
jgi:hypothetical protein